jgi:hypothetical protein
MYEGFEKLGTGPSSMYSMMRNYQRQVDRLKERMLSNYFSPDEIRSIISNIREALKKLGGEASASQFGLIRNLIMKLEELTSMMKEKSRWDRRFGKNPS